jgi:transcription elongation factor Elf1
MSERAVPFYCPYCGEEDLRPAEQTEKVPHGAWYCGSCLRTFAVKMIGIGVPDVRVANEPSDTAPGEQRRPSAARAVTR